MSRLIKRTVVNGGFKETGKVLSFKNLGWLFRHAKQVTELHFDATPANMTCYILRAYMMNGDIYETEYGSREVFCGVFNRNRTLKGLMCFSNKFHDEPVGELTTFAKRE